MENNDYDIAIIGGGPAGLQAALILSRTRKRTVVFDAPHPPRNGASHGVHNFLGLNGLLPSEIREQAWQQIDVYNSAELRQEKVVDMHTHDVGFAVHTEAGTSITAKHVILALGYRDVYPEIPGFRACWGDTIIACPFCDGYENRDRVWGLVASSPMALQHMPKMHQNWTQQAKIILTPQVTLDEDYHAELTGQGISIHEGTIAEIQHVDGKIESVILDTGEQVTLGTLWWRPDETPQALTEKIITDFELALDENGYIKTDAQHQTTIPGLWVVGDVKGWATALGAAHQASQAAYAIASHWYVDVH